ncbi:MAG TPA: bifunctional phosphopantothenoylcysteine decarboxylase/phosphopantothenate--cysteine ligase CoaBC [Chromatiales bacterium]|nr:bifunctional phosphopantothenoylcysteine decarboxylase/phosphopantothenate--cysteine ligase CoaBC [Thiotrichales bacterium]HIP68367.1 bifunctional phosphopantothenoylcysteine decarboxylase/phosphopantothenate--cysteine ligase CoaBC [Chromatiales bacterium]
MSLENKQILLGVTGGIAAYKTAELTRLLTRAGASVRVVMTRGAQAFVTPLTFQALSGEPVRTELLDPKHEAAMGHIELARWADLILVAPATASFIERLATGRADDLLSTLCLASASPIMLAPAMNQQMWQQQATQDNVQILLKRDIKIIGPAEGDQACGDVGPGRMLEPQKILQLAEQHFHTGALAGKRIMITAGPTREPIDPVRFLSNRSSGKMGYALAQAAVEAGATVTLITGPVNLTTPRSVKRINVETAEAMRAAVFETIDRSDIFIATAAVSDYRPVTAAEQKIKKSAEHLTLELLPNPDILAEVAALEKPPFTVGFAAETESLEKHAQAKLQRKKLNMIAANPVNDNQGFDQDENQLAVFWSDGEQRFPLTTKYKLARQLISLIAEQYHST